MVRVIVDVFIDRFCSLYELSDETRSPASGVLLGTKMRRGIYFLSAIPAITLSAVKMFFDDNGNHL